MSSPYERVKGGRLTFKDGSVATRSKAIDKKSNKKKNNKHKDKEKTKQQLLANPNSDEVHAGDAAEAAEAAAAGPEAYTIDAAKRMKYEQLFPVEAKKFGYDPKAIEYKSVEDALDDRAKKKADRYCK